MVDDGEGIRLNDAGVPDFDFVATHVCDSIKRRLKARGATGIQGEFGIGLLSFWTVGERLVLSSAGADGRVHDMEMIKGEPHYKVTKRRLLFSQPGTELLVKPLLAGIRQLNPERIQAFLASELRERIRSSGVRIRIKDRRARKDLEVVPREFTGRLLREIGPVNTPDGAVEAELYVGEAQPEHRVALFRNGTRVVPDISRLPGLEREPWTSGLLRGMIEAPFVQLTPGTRDGVVFDARYATLCRALEELEPRVIEQVERERAAAEDEASRSILRSVRKALTEGLLALPNADYQWLEVAEPRRRTAAGAPGTATSARGQNAGDTPLIGLDDAGSLAPEAGATPPEAAAGDTEARAFHEHAGPLYKVTVSPASAVVKVGETCTIRCLPKDRRGRPIEAGVEVSWQVVDGAGSLRDRDREVGDLRGAGRAGPFGHPRDRQPAGERVQCGCQRDHNRVARRPFRQSAAEQRAWHSPVHVPPCAGRAVALPLRRAAQPDRGQQRPQRLPLRFREAGTRAALHAAAVRQGTGAGELSRLRARRVAGADDRALPLRRGAPALALPGGVSPQWPALL